MDTQQMMELLLARRDENAKTMNEKMDANTKATLADREQRKAEREANREQRRADMEEILAKMEERTTATQAKTEGKLKELTETIEKTLTEPKDEMLQPAGEHQEVPREDALVIPVRGRKRRHRGRKKAAG
jgi:1,6-anhydro-N-acetylmuramate kinase